MDPEKEEKLRKLKLLKQKRGALLEKMPLLHKFIYEKSTNYIEPQREGTPRGEPIGFPRKKYEASLWMITNRKQKDIAQEIGVSYGLLRKWNTEAAFKKQVFMNAEEFTSVFRSRIRERIAEGKRLQEQLLTRPIKEMAEAEPIWTVGANDYKDAASYGDLVFSMISKAVRKELSRDKRKTKDFSGDGGDRMVLAFEWDFALASMMHFSGISRPPEIRQRDKEIRKILEGDLLRRVKEILLQPPTEEERKEAVFILSQLEKARE